MSRSTGRLPPFRIESGSTQVYRSRRPKKLFHILAVLVSLSAVFSYLNHRFLRLPTAIGLMLIALLMSLGLALLGPLGVGLDQEVQVLLRRVDFDETLLHGMWTGGCWV